MASGITRAGLPVGLVACVHLVLQAGQAVPAQGTAARTPALTALVAAAVKEGSLSYWDTVIQEKTNAALVDGFRKYYGLPASFTVNYSLAVSTNLITRFEQEVAARRVTMDVVAVASLPWLHGKVNAGQIMSYASPEYPAYRGAFARGLGKDGYFAFNGAYAFVPMWNATKLDYKGAAWTDAVNAVPSGRMSIGDAQMSQTYLLTYMGLKSVLPADYFKRVAAMKPVLLNRSERIASQLVTGQNLLAFFGMPTRAYQMNQRGAKLKFVWPKEGVVLLPQAMFMPATAPHPAAAKLWLDFVLSETGQRIIVGQEALISGRGGFVSPMPDYAPALDTLNVVKVDWEKITIADMEKARAEWRSLFGQ